MKCRHCSAPRATLLFNIQLCCESRKKRRIWLCEKCDANIQSWVMHFLHLEAK